MSPTRPLTAIDETGFVEYRGRIRSGLERMAEDERQPFSAAYAMAAIGIFDHPDEVYLQGRLYQANPERTAPEALRMLRASRAFLLLRRPGIAYPYEYSMPGDWLDGFAWMREEPDAMQQLEDCHVNRILGTSISQRYGSVKFLDAALEHLVGLFPTRLDVGCGNNTGNRRIVLSDHAEQFNFDRIKVMTGRKLGSLALSKEKTAIFNPLLANRDVTRRILGVDRDDPADEATNRWRVACLLPEEIISGKIARMNDALIHTDVDKERLDIRQADVTIESDIDAILETEGLFDVTSAVTSIYSGTRAEQRAKLAALLRFRKPSGVSYVIDFMRRPNGNGHTLIPLKDWVEMNVYVQRGNEEFVRVMAATSGRWKAVRFFKELTRFTDGGRYEAEARALVAA
jgi:hypothetical protein